MKADREHIAETQARLDEYAQARREAFGFERVSLEMFDLGRQVGVCATRGRLRHAKRTEDLTPTGVENVLIYLRRWFDDKRPDN